MIAPNALAEMSAILMDSPTVGMVYTSFQVIDELGQVRGQGTRCQIPYSKDQLLVDFITFHFRLMRRSVYEVDEPIANQSFATQPKIWRKFYFADANLCFKVQDLI